MKKRTLSVILLLALSLVFCLNSCGNKAIKYDEEEVASAASTLIRNSQEFNEIFWGNGITYTEGTDYDNGIYSPATPDFKYTTIEDILSVAGKVFSEGYMRNVKATIFSAQFGDTGVEGYARYYQESKIEPIMVRTDYRPVMVDKNEYIYDTLTVVGSDESKVYVKLSVKVTRGDESQVIERKISLVKEDGWRIDSHSFSNYYANN